MSSNKPVGYTYDSRTTDIGKISLEVSGDRATFLRRVIGGPQPAVCTQNGNIDGSVYLSIEDINEVLSVESPMDLVEVEPVEGVSDNNYICELCGSETGDVLRYVSTNGMFPINFHYDCLQLIAETGKKLTDMNSSELVSNRI